MHWTLRPRRVRKTQVLSWLARLKPLIALPATLALAGCNGFSILNPSGQIGLDERWIIYLCTILMLLVVIPVIGMVLVFAWRYRADNAQTEDDYAPEWSHSNRIEAIVWLVPCVIVAALAVVAWTSSHSLDPYKPIASKNKPITVDVVSLDWKWLFIYPEQGIASVNQLAMPANTPVEFHLTSGSVMNSFFIPKLGGQIYTMAGMETRLALIANQPGTYQGLSANYSGGGFSGMDFKAIAMSKSDFDAWVKQVKGSDKSLDAKTYQALAQPSEDAPVVHFASVAPDLFQHILRKCFMGAGACQMSAQAANADDSRMKAIEAKFEEGPKCSAN